MTIAVDEKPSEIETLTLTTVQFRAFIKTLAKNAGSMAELARQLDVSGQFIGDIVAGKKHPGPKLLSKIGATATTIYTVTLERGEE